MEKSLAEKILDNKETVATVRRFGIGVLLALSIPFGVGGIIATGAFCVGLNAAVFGVEKKLRERQLVDFYKDEVGAFLNKKPDSVTIDDLRKVAAPVEEGGKGITVLQKELEGHKTHQKFRTLYSVVGSAITTGILVGLSLAFPGFTSGAMGMVIGLGLAGLGHNLVARTVRGIGKMIFGDHDIDNSVSQRLIKISHEIKQKPVAPVEVFNLLADTHPELQSEIKQTYGKNYADLPVIQKKQVAEAYEEQYRIIGLTEEINNGNIRPSMAGFILSHHLDPQLPDYQDYQSLFTKPVSKISDNALASDDATHTKRLLAERGEPTPSKSLH